MMNISDYQPKRLFTVEEANAALPLVKAICNDLSALAREVIDRRERLSELSANREADRSDLYSSELSQVEIELENDMQRLQEFINELQELGVEPKDAVRGLVDFPSEMDGRIVYLCWQLGEKEVAFWHDLEAGFAGRKPLTATTIIESSATEQGDNSFDS